MLRLVWLALVMGAATVFLVSYAVAPSGDGNSDLRARGRALDRLYGRAPKRSSPQSSALLGVMSGHVMAWYIAWKAHAASAPPSDRVLSLPSGVAGAAVLLLATAAGLLPAIQSYRQEVAVICDHAVAFHRLPSGGNAMFRSIPPISRVHLACRCR